MCCFAFNTRVVSHLPLLFPEVWRFLLLDIVLHLVIKVWTILLYLKTFS